MSCCVFKKACCRAIPYTLNPPHTSIVFGGQRWLLQLLPAPLTVASHRSCLSSLALLGRLLQGRMSLLGGRPVPPHFLQLMTGDQSVSFGSEEVDDFRRRLDNQLKELRNTLRSRQQIDEVQRQETERGEISEVADAEEDSPYAVAQDFTSEKATEEELEKMRSTRMSQRGSREWDAGEAPARRWETTSEMETEDEAEDSIRAEADVEDEMIDPHQSLREEDIEGVYWTGEGKKVLKIHPVERTGGASGYISGDGKEIPNFVDPEKTEPQAKDMRRQEWDDE
ncbi:hypothetical protein KR018_006493 [Drosophila ironensis]|nr:hypothetical protein KR018_006493 [Drosophila ironensis]